VPVPKAIDIADLNRLLLAECQRDEHRVIAGREQCIGAAAVVEREHLLPLVPEGMDLARITFPTVNSLGCAKVLTPTNKHWFHRPRNKVIRRRRPTVEFLTIRARVLAFCVRLSD
jgi:hypothetical protein